MHCTCTPCDCLYIMHKTQNAAIRCTLCMRAIASTLCVRICSGCSCCSCCSWALAIKQSILCLSPVAYTPSRMLFAHTLSGLSGATHVPVFIKTRSVDASFDARLVHRVKICKTFTKSAVFAASWLWGRGMTLRLLACRVCSYPYCLEQESSRPLRMARTCRTF